MALSVGIALAGIALARWMYLVRTDLPERLQATAPGLYNLLWNKWYLDELYNALFVRGLTLGGGRLMSTVDSRIVDGGVNGAGWLTKAVSSLSIWWDTYIIDGVVRLTAFTLRVVSIPVRLAQSGSVQGYALAIVLGILVLMGIYGRN